MFSNIDTEVLRTIWQESDGSMNQSIDVLSSISTDVNPTKVLMTAGTTPQLYWG